MLEQAIRYLKKQLIIFLVTMSLMKNKNKASLIEKFNNYKKIKIFFLLN